MNSTNERAKQICWLRDLQGAVPIDQPCELDFKCPVCDYEVCKDGNYDERLQWSEYNNFIWCSVCNKDYPSCFCKTPVDKAIDMFLDCLENNK